MTIYILLVYGFVLTVAAGFTALWIGLIIHEAVVLNRISRYVRATRVQTASPTAVEARVAEAMGIGERRSRGQERLLLLIRAEVADQLGEGAD